MASPAPFLPRRRYVGMRLTLLLLAVTLLGLPLATADNLALRDAQVLPRHPEAGETLAATVLVDWQGNDTTVVVALYLNTIEKERWSLNMSDGTVANLSYHWPAEEGPVMVTFRGDPDEVLNETRFDDNVLTVPVDVQEPQETNPLWYVAAGGVVLLCSGLGYWYAWNSYRRPGPNDASPDGIPGNADAGGGATSERPDDETPLDDDKTLSYDEKAPPSQ